MPTIKPFMITENSAYELESENLPPNVFAEVFPASLESVQTILEYLNEVDKNGDTLEASQWCWIRLGDGSIALGVFPFGEAYLDVIDDIDIDRADVGAIEAVSLGT